jgi:UDP-glucose 4-epimerase
VNSLFCKEANGRVFNIGNDSEPISVKKLAEKTINLIGKNGISPQYVAMENSDRTKKREVYNRIPTIEKARKVLQYSPKVSLDEGITNVINYWNRNELKV